MGGDGTALAVLVVAADEADAEDVARRLEHGSARIETTVEADPTAVTAEVRTAAYDVVVCAHELGDTDAVALTGELRSAGVTTPVVVLAADGSETIASDALAAGATDYVPRGYLEAERLAERVVGATRDEDIAEQVDAFVRMVTHDVRNPLSVASGWLRLLYESGEREHYERTADALERIEEIVDDLAALVREEAASVDRTAVELSAVATAAWETVETGDAELAVEYGPAVHADRSKLREVLENLFANAVDHGGDDVTVEVVPTEADDGFVVADDGAGIPSAQRGQVFERGFTTSDDGTGIGLAIVDRIAAAHGWDVAVTESDAGGARFTFTNVDVTRPNVAVDPGN